MLKPIYDAIPSELQTYPQFVNWRTILRDGKPTKPPFQANGTLASSTDPSTWTDFTTARNAAERFDGIGFVLTQADPFAALDFDNCRCPAFDNLHPGIAGGLDMVLPGIADHIRRMHSYTEISPSGKGIRVIVKGRISSSGAKKGAIEAYQAGRYVTITGHRVEGLPATIEERSAELADFYQTVFGKMEKTDRPYSAPLGGDWQARLQRAFESRSGSDIRRLWNGDFAAYPSQSEADLALCAHLAFWLDGDQAAMDAAFRQSGLIRNKWDEKHGPCTYGEATIQKALAGCKSFYGDRTQSETRGENTRTGSKPHQDTKEEPKDTERIKIVNASTWLSINPAEPDQILEDTFDVGDKIAIIGSSKLRKSFFLLMMLLDIAAGRDFLPWRVVKPRRVFHIQLEIQSNHYHRRVRRMAQALGIGPEDLTDHLQIVNARGLGLTGTDGVKRIRELVTEFHPEIISFDPLYKIASGVENAAEDFKIVLNSFDELAEVSGAAIAYVHHDSKGTAGDRDIRDRGAGSGVLGRDYDACITLTPHAQEEDAIVVETLLRNYRPQDAFTIAWQEDMETGGYRFEQRPDIMAEKKTSRTRPQLPSLATYFPAAESILKKKEMDVASFKVSFKEMTGLGDHRIRDFLAWATAGGSPYITTREIRGDKLHKKWLKLERRPGNEG